MKTLLIAAAALALSTTAGFAAGDADKGEADFKRCRSCHTIANGDEVIVKGGKTGPNLYGVIGRTAGSVEGFKYGKDMLAAGEAGLVWSEENIALYVPDPKGFLAETLGKGSGSSKMTPQRLKDPANVAAFLASFSPEDESADMDEDSDHEKHDDEEMEDHKESD